MRPLRGPGALLLLLLATAAPAPGQDREDCPPDGAASVRTPPWGSRERRVVLDALRAELRRHDPKPLVFVVRQLRAQGDWAWVQVDPRSPDGRSRYESESALLERREGRWWVVERMPAFGERELTGMEDDCRYFAAVRVRWPAAPVCIFPAAGRDRCPERSRPNRP